MAGKKNKAAGAGTYPVSRELNVAEEPQAAYLPGQGLRWVKGKNPEKNFVKRSLEMMGIAQLAPFNKVENLADFITCIRAGVPKRAMDHLMEITGINATEMAGITRTSDRTLRRYSAKQRLNAEQSERVIELAKVYSRGEVVFGTLAAFREWMNSSVLALGNQKPKEFLDTSMGIEMLMEELGRIEHGIFA
jgi:putative toxin-antitoxin system antitoxin component (TIGR02293 family)